MKGVSPDSTNEDGLTALHQVCVGLVLWYEVPAIHKVVGFLGKEALKYHVCCICLNMS
jgi:hypothetical protein